MTGIDQHPIPFRMDAYPVDAAQITALPTFTAVMNLQLSLCPFTSDKDAARRLKIDPALFSRRRSGQAPWQVSDVDAVMQFAHSLLPVAWWAHRYGHGLVMLKDEAQLRAEAMQRRIDELEFRNRVLVEAFNGKAA